MLWLRIDGRQLTPQSVLREVDRLLARLKIPRTDSPFYRLSRPNAESDQGFLGWAYSVDMLRNVSNADLTSWSFRGTRLTRSGTPCICKKSTFFDKNRDKLDVFRICRDI